MYWIGLNWKSHGWGAFSVETLEFDWKIGLGEPLSEEHFEFSTFKMTQDFTFTVVMIGSSSQLV